MGCVGGGGQIANDSILGQLLSWILSCLGLRFTIMLCIPVEPSFIMAEDETVVPVVPVPLKKAGKHKGESY